MLSKDPGEFCGCGASVQIAQQQVEGLQPQGRVGHVPKPGLVRRSNQKVTADVVLQNLLYLTIRIIRIESKAE